MTLIDLRDLALPVVRTRIWRMRGDCRRSEAAQGADGRAAWAIVASPEYNGSSITAPLKNAIDWASRAESDDEPDLLAYRGKTAALFSASPGALGGMRSLVTLRWVLGNIGVHVLPEQVTISAAYDAFDEAGQLKDDSKAKRVAGLAKQLVDFTIKHRA